MPAFKDEQIIIIAPGSQTTLAQLGLPESFTPARLRVRSCMFPAEKEGEWEPYKVRRKNPAVSNGETVSQNGEEPVYEEDFESEEGAVWPIVEGKIVNWSCFFALVSHVFNSLNPPFHTPILLIVQQCWTPKQYERLTQFFFEKFKTPAFSMMDSATATAWAYGVENATVIDVGYQKADVTAISSYTAHETGKASAIQGCGGDAMTTRLLELLESKGFTKDMCEQLKRSPVCEVLPPDTPLPGSGETEKETVVNPAAAASTGIGAGQRKPSVAEVPRGPGPFTEVGDDKADGDNEGVLDVASIVASGKTSEFLSQKEREKQQKAASKKKGAAEAQSTAAKPTRLPNAKRERNTFTYVDSSTMDAFKQMSINGAPTETEPTSPVEKKQKTPEPAGALATSADSSAKSEDAGQPPAPATSEGAPNGSVSTNGAAKESQPKANGHAPPGPQRKEVEVGIERFQAATGGILDILADTIHRVICSVEEVGSRAELWDSLIIVGNGAKVRGFKDALLNTITNRYLISPSSATIFTSELPSNFSTPTGTGANTPQPQMGLHPSSHVNPLLLAATTAQNPHLLNPNASLGPHHHHSSAHSSHGQSPTSIKFAKVPEYFPEWKDVGFDEATFLGAQVAAKVFFVQDQGQSKCYMTRPDYNDQGPVGIHDYKI